MSSVGFSTRCGANLRRSASGNLLFRKIDQDRALCTGIFQRRLQPRERPFIDDRRVVLAVDVREALGEQSPAMADELVLTSFGQKHVVDIRTDLTGIEHLHPENALRRCFDREVRPNDRRCLAAQFKRDRGEVAGRVGHDRATGSTGSREQQMVEGQ